MAGFLVTLVSLSFIPGIELAQLPPSCVRDRNVLSCFSLGDFKNKDILSAVMHDMNIDVIYLTERISFCFCKTLRLVQLLRITEIIVFTHNKCTLSRFKKCGLMQPMPMAEVFAGLVISVDDPRRNWALNHHVLHLWSKIHGVRSKKMKSLFYAGILKDLKNEVMSLNVQARETLLAMRPKTTNSRRVVKSRIRVSTRRYRGIRRRNGSKRLAKLKKKWFKKIHYLEKGRDVLKGYLMKARLKNRRMTFNFRKISLEDEMLLRKIEKQPFIGRRRRREAELQIPHSQKSLFNLEIHYIMRLNTTRFKTSIGNVTAFRKFTSVGKVKPRAIHQAKEDSLSVREFRKWLNPAVYSWLALGHQNLALSRSLNSRMRRATKTSDPPTVIPYLAFVGGEFYSIFDQEGIRLAQRQEVKPIEAEEKLRAPRRNYPVTGVRKRRPVKRNRKRKQLAAKLRSPRTNKRADVKKLPRESDHRMKSFIIFFLAITGIITIIAVLLIMAMRSSGQSPRNGERRGRCTCPDDRCRQCKANMKCNGRLINQSEAEVCRHYPVYPYYDDKDPFSNRPRTQPDTNWNANSELYRNHSPLVSFLKSIATEKDGVMRENHREKFDIKRCHQKFLFQPQLHEQRVPASRLPHSARPCRPSESVDTEMEPEKNVSTKCVEQQTLCYSQFTRTT